MKKIGIYLRTSTLKTEGIHSQRLAIERFLHSEESLFSIYRDDGISGAVISRPGFNKLKDDISKGLINRVVTYSFSRISRSLKDLINTLAFFEKYNVKLDSVSEKFSMDSSHGKLIISILGAIAEYERDIISERVKAGMRAAKERGSKIGRDKTIDRDLLRQLHKQGLSYSQISKILNCSRASISRIIQGVQ